MQAGTTRYAIHAGRDLCLHTDIQILYLYTTTVGMMLRLSYGYCVLDEEPSFQFQTATKYCRAPHLTLRPRQVRQFEVPLRKMSAGFKGGICMWQKIGVCEEEKLSKIHAAMVDFVVCSSSVPGTGAGTFYFYLHTIAILILV